MKVESKPQKAESKLTKPNSKVRKEESNSPKVESKLEIQKNRKRKGPKQGNSVPATFTSKDIGISKRVLLSA